MKSFKVAIRCLILSCVLVMAQDENLDFETVSSRTCRKDCINEMGNFCATLDLKRGTCCGWNQYDCGGHGGWCANDIAKRYSGLEYWVCPRENFCGDLVHIA